MVNLVWRGTCLELSDPAETERERERERDRERESGCAMSFKE